MAPEQLEGKPTDARTDLWALGAVLYEMLTGCRPFAADSQAGVIAAILDREPVPLAALQPASPPALDRLVRECLAKDAAERRQSAADLADDLRVCKERVGVTSGSPSGAPVGAVEGLRVAAASSTFYLKGQALETRVIGQRLNVETLLEGSVRRAGNRLRVTAPLVVSDGYHLWAERYDRELDDVFAVQDDIARAIVEKLKVRLVGAGDHPLVKRSSRNLEAYELYLQGRYFFARRFKGGLEQAVECFTRAVALDRDFAGAHAGLALARAAMGFWGYALPRQVRPNALEVAERAVMLDASLADAEREAERAVALDPLSALVLYLATTAYFYNRQFRRTIEVAQQAISVDPGFLPAYFTKTLALTAVRRHAEALETAELGVQLAGRVPFMLAPLGGALVRAGRPAAARAILNELVERSEREPVGATWLAGLYGTLGEVDKAFAILERGSPDWGPTYPFNLAALPWDVLRAHPRFQDIATSVGCPSLVSTRWSFVPRRLRGTLIRWLVRSAVAIRSARSEPPRPTC